MILFKHPAFARLPPKMEHARTELAELQKYSRKH
jgi:hypothetical protein